MTDSVVAVLTHSVTIADTIALVDAAGGFLGLLVAPASRTQRVPAESRVTTVPSEDRTVRVPAESRTMEA